MPYSRQAVDAAAESEGLALEAMAEYLDREIPQTRRQVILGQVRMADALGRPLNPKLPPYRKVCSMKAFARIAEADRHYLTWGPPACKRVPSTNDLESRGRKAVARLAAYVRLQELPSRRVVGLAEASALTGGAIGERTLQRAAVEGRLVAVKSIVTTRANRTTRWTCTVGAVREMLGRKISRKPAAA